jgi:hypothetical protein
VYARSVRCVPRCRSLFTGLAAVGRLPVTWACEAGVHVAGGAGDFRSHGAVGPQVAEYAAVVIVNYLVWILGVGDGLAALGLDYRLARIAAGACEALYMYAAMRWLVFRDAQRRRGRANPS